MTGPAVSIQGVLGSLAFYGAAIFLLIAVMGLLKGPGASELRTRLAVFHVSVVTGLYLCTTWLMLNLRLGDSNGPVVSAAGLWLTGPVLWGIKVRNILDTTARSRAIHARAASETDARTAQWAREHPESWQFRLLRANALQDQAGKAARVWSGGGPPPSCRAGEPAARFRAPKRGGSARAQ
jgi:hypothetical protein